MQKKHALLILLSILLLALSSCQKKKAISGSKPNIILILADDLGYGDLGCYGQEKIKTPHLDTMAEQGLMFTQFYAGGAVGTSSQAVLMTGLHNGNTSVKTMEKPLDDSDITIAEKLKEAGYKTGIIGKWNLGNQGSEGFPNAQGFDYSYGYYNDIRSHNSYPDYLYCDGKKEHLDNEVVYIKDKTHYAAGIGNASTLKNTFSNQLFTDKAGDFIEHSSAEPFFLYLSYTIPHANNESWLTGDNAMEVPGYGIYETEQWPEAQKAGAALISLLDQYVGNILQKITDKGIADNTIIIFSSGNGPHGEGGWRPDFFNSNSIFRGMKRDLYEGGIRVPFIVWCPNRVKAGVSDEIGTFWDMMPTFCEMAGVESPWTDGISLVSSFEGKPGKGERGVLYWEFRTSTLKQAVRNGDWKAIRINKEGKFYPTELYNISKDAQEQNNVAIQHKRVVENLEDIMNNYN